VKTVFRNLICFPIAIGLSTWPGAPLFAKDKPKPAGQAVDSGSFGIFRSGTRVATETFSIAQSAEGNVVTSQFKSAQGEQFAEQSIV